MAFPSHVLQKRAQCCHANMLLLDVTWREVHNTGSLLLLLLVLFGSRSVCVCVCVCVCVTPAGEHYVQFGPKCQASGGYSGMCACMCTFVGGCYLCVRACGWLLLGVLRAKGLADYLEPPISSM
jgi:hypothetical protein